MPGDLPTMGAAADLIACHECDLLQRAPLLAPGATASCRRCGGVLYRRRRKSIERTLALAVAGLILFTAANTLPFLAFRMQGQVVETTLITGVRDLHEQGMTALAALVLVTSILAPLGQLLALLYVLLPMYVARPAPGAATVFRFLRRLQPWSMMEVFMLGVLVSLVKLADMAEIVPGLAIWSFSLLILVIAAASATLEPRQVWLRLGAS